MRYRIERDAMGEVEVPADRYWGAQTQRAIRNFRIGSERLPAPLLRAMGVVKQCAALVNVACGDLDADKGDAIQRAAAEMIDGRLDDHFPLVVWQSGSGTQSNMNANEVIANRAIEILGGELGSRSPVHPNDDVNRAQSTNDTFPTAVHVAVACEIHARLLPALRSLRTTLDRKARDFAAVVKIGRTHLQDATPLTLGQEFSGYADQLRICEDALGAVMPLVLELPIGGTAVGTGLNTRAGYAEKMVAAISDRCGLGFIPAGNRFAAIAGKDALVAVSGVLKTLAAALNKIANDVRWLASGPRCGIGEIVIPANEPGSSIMPGKVNPTQCEALTMVAARVFGNDVTVTLAGSGGNFELNAYMPVIAYAVLQSVDLLAGAVASFDTHCAAGIEPDRARIQQNLERSLMLVTALVPHLGYDVAADIARTAHETGRTLREVVMERGLMSSDRYDSLVAPDDMLRPR